MRRAVKYWIEYTPGTGQRSVVYPCYAPTLLGAKRLLSAIVKERYVGGSASLYDKNPAITGGLVSLFWKER